MSGGRHCSRCRTLAAANRCTLAGPPAGAPQWAVLTAHYAIVVHMVSAWQVFAQPIFDLIESQVKVRADTAAVWHTGCEQAASCFDAQPLPRTQAWRIRRQLRRAHAKAGTAPAQCQPAASVASNGGCSGVSPKPSSVPAPLEVVAEEGSQQEASSHFGELPDGPLGRRHLSSRSFHGGPVTYNSAPLPDLLPPKRQRAGAHGRSLAAVTLACRPRRLPASLLLADALLLPSVLDTLAGWAHQETFFRRTLMAEARATDALPTAGTAPIHRSGSRCTRHAPLVLRAGIGSWLGWLLRRLTTARVGCRAQACPCPLACRSFLSLLEHSRAGMYRQCPGLANEHVPLNESGFLLPLPLVRREGGGGRPRCLAVGSRGRLQAMRGLWRPSRPFPAPAPQRLLMRTLCVLALTALAVVMPFVLPATGLVGSICWYPLTVGFPFLCWAKVACGGGGGRLRGRAGGQLAGSAAPAGAGMRDTATPCPQVYRPTGARLVLMWLVGLAMLLVALAATVGSVYSLVNSLQSVEWFQ